MDMPIWHQLRMCVPLDTPSCHQHQVLELTIFPPVVSTAVQNHREKTDMRDWSCSRQTDDQ